MSTMPRDARHAFQSATPATIPLLSRPLIALFDSSDDMREMLSILLEAHGYRSITRRVSELHTGRIDLPGFIAQYRPVLVVYELVPPYQRHWTFFEAICAHPSVRDLPFVMLCTARRAAQQLADTCASLTVHILGRPFEFADLLAAIRDGLTGARVPPEQK